MTENANKIYKKSDITAALTAMGAPRGVVVVHSSLRSVGRVEGGGEGLLDALIEYFTAEGGVLAIPTHTWHRLGEDITLDMKDGKTALGVLSDLAALDSRGVRSENPTHSVALFGDRKKIAELIRDEARLSTPTAENGFWGRLYTEGGQVLLIGVGLEKNTYFHAVEEILNIPNRMGEKPLPVAVRHKDGSVTRSSLRLYDADFSDDVSHRFPKFEEALRYHRAISDGYIGNAYSRIVSCKRSLEVLRLVYSRAESDPLADEVPIDPRTYVI